MDGNRLKDRRIAEGLTITELAHYSNICTKIISQTERFLKDPTEVTKRKIVNGLNAAKKRGEDLTTLNISSHEKMVIDCMSDKAPESGLLDPDSGFLRGSICTGCAWSCLQIAK